MAGVIDAAEKAADVETTIRRVISTATRDQPLFEQQYKLSELLDRVERRLIDYSPLPVLQPMMMCSTSSH